MSFIIKQGATRGDFDAVVKSQSMAENMPNHGYVEREIAGGKQIVNLFFDQDAGTLTVQGCDVLSSPANPSIRDWAPSQAYELIPKVS